MRKIVEYTIEELISKLGEPGVGYLDKTITLKWDIDIWLRFDLKRSLTELMIKGKRWILRNNEWFNINGESVWKEIERL